MYVRGSSAPSDRTETPFWVILDQLLTVAYSRKVSS